MYRPGHLRKDHRQTMEEVMRNYQDLIDDLRDLAARYRQDAGSTYADTAGPV